MTLIEQIDYIIIKNLDGSLSLRTTKTICTMTGILGYSFDNELCSMSKAGALIIKSGFTWNGPNLINKLLRKNNNFKILLRMIFPSLVHDALYTLIAAKLFTSCNCATVAHSFYSLRLAADQLFFRQLRFEGLSYFKSKVSYYAVRVFGKKGAQHNDRFNKRIDNKKDNCVL